MSALAEFHDERKQLAARVVEVEAELLLARTNVVKLPTIDTSTATGPDPRVAELEKQNEDLRTEAAGLQDRFDLELAGLDTALRAEIQTLVEARTENASSHSSTLALVTEARNELASELAKAQKEHEQVIGRLTQVERAYSSTKKALETQLEATRQKASDADARIEELVAAEAALRLDISMLTDARTQDASNHAIELDLLARARDDLSSAFAAAQLENRTAAARIVELEGGLSDVRNALGRRSTLQSRGGPLDGRSDARGCQSRFGGDARGEHIGERGGR